MTHRIINFSAGPAVLPLEVLEEAQRDLVDYKGAGLSVMEMSHRSPHYDAIHQGAIASLRSLVGIGEDYAVLFLQGGASLQFSMVPMNLMHPARKADYVLTGPWSQKALKEAVKEGGARAAGSSEGTGFDRIPAASDLDLDGEADYVHFTSNNTIVGTQWRSEPEAGDVPLVADMSSDILSRPIDVARYGLIYAGAQKNLGPAGVTLVIVRKDLLERAPESLPTMLAYRTHAAKSSLYNTPPCWSIYVVGLACQWLERQGGLEAMARRNAEKAARLYDLIDAGDFYRGTAQVASRSLMNVPFRLPSEELESRFLETAKEADMTNLKGHRSVGGIRASIYNAMPLESVDRLVELMREFERTHG
ncbi:MAG: 3-phosphoserine/phosphohydroxythreonine transaminase [Acidobacteriota bacterium]|nr:3-phosphoserine/phosphohydroxythreonine transaminase [Acidobacteriota bacterium]MDH3523266.1 3-phosphoserine/phosphohydroxythreonine transaminase [Acidobacteriota bacterium]